MVGSGGVFLDLQGIQESLLLVLKLLASTLIPLGLDFFLLQEFSDLPCADLALDANI